MIDLEKELEKIKSETKAMQGLKIEAMELEMLIVKQEQQLRKTKQMLIKKTDAINNLGGLYLYLDDHLD